MGTKDRLMTNTKRAVRHMSPRHMIKSHISGRTMRNYAEKVGLVYFGNIGRNEEDQRLIRGHTVSPTHIDNHYCVGTVRGYDVAMVVRNDVVPIGAGQTERCHWLIVTFDLLTKYELPHIYIGHRSRQNVYVAAHRQLMELPLGAYNQYPSKFLNNYSIYGAPAHHTIIERLINPQIAEIIQSHFSAASVEIEDNTVYLYIESRYPTEAIIEKMVSNGLWFAANIDAMLSPQPGPAADDNEQ